MSRAKEVACDVLYKTTDPIYEENIRQFQGCPTLVITKKGRIYAGWYAGGTREPHMDNYNLLVYSDDLGKSWSKPLLVIPSRKGVEGVQALDIQLWIDQDGRLHVNWVQNNTIGLVPDYNGETYFKQGDNVDPKYWEGVERDKGQGVCEGDGYIFNDFTHAWWEVVCDDPDAKNPTFTTPRYVDKGFLRCKPLVLANGDWLCFNYDQTQWEYGYSISKDKGKTYQHYYGTKKLATPFDEGMAYQKLDGSVRMFARTSLGEIAECTSTDNGLTWGEAKLSGIDSPNTRFYVARTPSGRVLLVNNDDRKDRKNMTLYLSEDDGKTWKYKRCIDTRGGISYPDVDFYDGKIYLIYDRERWAAKEILFCVFTEEDIMHAENLIDIKIISKP